MKSQAPKNRPSTRPLSKRARKLPLSNKSFRVVGIGASAGGLDAFTQLLRPLPIDTGMAFVLVQHLDPGHKSMLTEIVGRETRMPVSEVRDHMTLEPNHVYVIPPNTQMSLQKGILHLVPRAIVHGASLPIDFFLCSLAADKGPLAIAVILSGADADGSQALEAIKAEGGIAFAQDSESAKFNTMPNHAVATGLVDFILPPERIAQELGRIARSPANTSFLSSPEEEFLPVGSDDLSKIYSLVKHHRGVDFTHYKQTTLKRRIQRRMLVQNVRTLAQYLQVLKTRPEEMGALYGDLLIHVTSFFRDPEVFEYLKKKVFPRLMKNRAPRDVFRIWVPGCSTGEEVYSIAMCLLEFTGPSGSKTPIQIFATDISDSALQKARAGIYTEQAMVHVSAERRRRFFSAVSGGYQVNKAIRSACIFSKQNVAYDPPFSRLDLISCRNVLIYLGSVLQKKVMPIFHYALKSQGLLILGKSEALSVFSDLFDPLDRKMKVYTKSASSSRHHPVFHSTSSLVEEMGKIEPGAPSDGNNLNVEKEADQYVLGKRAPAGVIIDGMMNIVQFRGEIDQYLKLPPGTATLQLFKMAKEGLLLELRSAIYKAKKVNAPVRSESLRVNQGGQFKNVTIEVVPLRQALPNESRFLVLFEESLSTDLPESKSGRSARGGKNKTARKADNFEKIQFKKELAATKSYLKSIIDEHERIIEELKSANEEALSSNEEFQSTNEELETAKEELQATNEETSTLNEDLHNRNLELARLNNDLVNLMNCVNIPTVILGKDHHIRRLTLTAVKMLNITTGDIGRSIHDLKLTIPILDFKELIDSVLQTLTPQQRDVQDTQGHWYQMRIQVYKTVDDVIDGVVLSFTDIQAAKEHQATAAEWTEDLEKRVKERTEELAKSQSALLQSEKLEAVGRLAGGVAHDFNNLMTGILGMTEDVQESLGKGDRRRKDLDDVVNAAKKAMTVTKQLLAFGRKQVFDPRVLNINNVIGDMKKLLQRLLGEDINLITRLDPRLGNVHMDESSIEQVILNLTLNARDSMPKGGKITLQTTNMEITNDTPKLNIEIVPGRYVALTVTDEGTGISPESMPHIFEPFFTTKGEGKGTGLGLATVYGIVKQSGGSLSLQSAIGQGTSFTIYLPNLGIGLSNERRVSKSRVASGGSETIIVTEDEEIVRKVAVRALRKKGYTVLQASSGKEAVKISEKYGDPIHLLLTDVIMPGMNGHELAELMVRKRPGLAVLYMSGYEKATITERGVLAPGTSFIEKSFSAEGLCHKVREVLDRATK